MDAPLLYRTPETWVERACEDPLRLLSDHVHLEKKAAANALELLNRWPGDEPPTGWVELLAAIARDEASHLFLVEKHLRRRGGRLEKAHRNPYVQALHERVRRGQGPKELIDRLLVCALIEARSCERFELLSEGCPDADLAALYRRLAVSEKGHYQVFLKLASLVDSGERARRWPGLLKEEAAIMRSQAAGPRLHSGCA